ncbi:helix-turn-helix transcriptional regulator [Haloterrigena sp. SYSU A558-1]|uniref:Helix-turn-helix transcriptional regulator n=1 Tax=Haloterrigena gelatinilytica TaxID=2741724 RepID=A0ABX2LHX7_9EURY|nr:PadR family transcriptional regulator [Haloterrigena gelatinilytica]NUC74983.1 helix-turn-helix transcriptional regulator [Haloterrigena gelatinilytica]
MAQADRSAMRAAPNLTAFQRDLLFVIASIGPAKGLAVKEELSDYYAAEINHGRLYPNLDTLVDSGYVEKGQMDKRTNSYELTPAGERVLESRRQWETERFGGDV